MLKEGYEKACTPWALVCVTELRLVLIQTKPGVFKIPTFRQWIVVPSGSELIEEVMKAPDNILSVREPLENVRIAAYIAQTRTYCDHVSSFNPSIPSAT